MTPLWKNDISILYEKKYLLEIIPKKDYDINRKLNTIVRISIYYSLIMYLMNKDINNLLIPIIVCIFTLIISRNSHSDEHETIVNLMNGSDNSNDIINELDESGVCRVPTKDNPFMNPSLFNSGKNKLEPCSSYNNKGIQKVIEDNFNNDLYMDVNDIFGKNNSQRQFYTVPGKSIPNNQKSFAEWLYKTPPTCKEGNGLQCIANQYSSLGEGPWNGSSPPATA
tara:strand:- start:309 stop:980 length:672 start_codon:yes stop_codon:yes gene_type:complete